MKAPITITGRVIQPNETVRKLNPHLFGLGAVGGATGKPSPGPALDQNPKTFPKRKGRMACVVTLVACRHRLCDSDSNAISFKPLQDAIARSLAIDDGSERIRFEYSQAHTTAAEGTIVRIAWV